MTYTHLGDWFMQESPAAQPYEVRQFIGRIIPVLLLGFVAFVAPIAVLITTEEPPPFPSPGWESSVTIYLWAARFTSAFIQTEYGLGGGVTNLHTIPFIIMTVLYCIIHIAVGLRKVPARSGAGIDVMVLIIWVTLCHLIYGTLQEWSLIQIPILPIVGVSILLVVYGSRVFQLSPTTPASSSYLSAL
jgi:hypothetical protein